MIQSIYNYEPNLPKTVQIKDKFNKAYSEALNAVSEAKLHWRALLATPEIKDRMQDVNKALDDKAAIIAYYDEKIAAVETLPIPPTEKARMVQEWQKSKDDASTHLNGLDDALDSLPCGYITYEAHDPDSVSISRKNLMEYANSQSKIQTPDEAHQLYEKFIAVINAIRDFHKYEKEKGLNERDFISVISHIHSAEEFATNWIFGTWKVYK